VAEEPRLDHRVALALRGDWGQANVYPVYGWPATWPDGVNRSGFAARKALRRVGLEPNSLRFSYDERPFPGIGEFDGGEADVLILEAVMTPGRAQTALGSAGGPALPGPAGAETPLVAGRATS
jgi:hypothetical protein